MFKELGQSKQKNKIELNNNTVFKEKGNGFGKLMRGSLRWI